MARPLPAVAPAADEIILPKGSSSVFISTNIEHLLRNMAISHLYITGGLTDQCVDSAVRDAADLGFLVTLVTDAVYTHSASRHETALSNNAGYCRQVDTETALAELQSLRGSCAKSTNNEPMTRPAPAPMSVARPITSTATAVRDFYRFEIIDFNGKALSKLVPERHARRPVFLYSGALALGACSAVLTMPPEIISRGCPNAQLLPDWSTLQLLPWASGTDPSSTTGSPSWRPPSRTWRVYCEQASVVGAEHAIGNGDVEESSPHRTSEGGVLRNPAVPRTVCAQMIAKAAEKGLAVLAASEFEFCLGRRGASDNGKCGEPVWEGGWAGEGAWLPAFGGVGGVGEIFVTLEGSKTADFQLEIEAAMDLVGIDVRTMNCEYGSGQLEITFEPKWGLAAGDAAATFKTAVKEIAQKRGLCATFYSKPFLLEGVGSGGHLNFSLWSTGAGEADTDADGHDRNAARTPLMRGDGQSGLSAVAESFLAGILAHGPALEAICAPTPGCYSRHGNWAPTHADWGPDDRTRAIRVHAGEEREAEQCYAELRMPSSSANTYLVLAGMIAAGLDGVERSLQLPPPRQTENDGAIPLPTSLHEALDCLKADKIFCERLGPTFVDWFVGLKRAELGKVDEWVEEIYPLASSQIQREEKKWEEAKLMAWDRMYFEFL